MLEFLTKFTFQVKYWSLPVLFSSSRMFSFFPLQRRWKVNHLPSSGTQPSTFWRVPASLTHSLSSHDSELHPLSRPTPIPLQQAQHSPPHLFSNDCPPWQPHLMKKQVQLKSMSFPDIFPLQQPKWKLSSWVFHFMLLTLSKVFLAVVVAADIH